MKGMEAEIQRALMNTLKAKGFSGKERRAILKFLEDEKKRFQERLEQENNVKVILEPKVLIELLAKKKDEINKHIETTIDLNLIHELKIAVDSELHESPTDIEFTLGSVSDIKNSTPDVFFSGASSFKNKYTIINELAAGGQGKILAAIDNYLHREVAIKIVKESSPNYDRFVQEMRIAALVGAHDNIITIYDYGRDERGMPYFTMPRIRGGNINEIMLNYIIQQKKEPKRKAKNKLYEFFIVALDAMKYAHNKGVIHRDIKPLNLMIDLKATESAKLVIVDWGAAKIIDEEISDADRMRTERLEQQQSLTISGMAIGTPNYMSPEQLTGDKEEIGLQSDIFALGGVLYTITTEITPYRHLGVGVNLAKIRIDEPSSLLPPRVVAPHLDIAPELEEIIMTAMAEDKNQRYQSLNAFKNDLKAYLAWEKEKERAEEEDKTYTFNFDEYKTR